VDEVTFTCPRCFYTAPVSDAGNFCPRCGLADVGNVAVDNEPMEVRNGTGVYRVMERIAVGSICSLYRCRFEAEGHEVEGVFKIARDARGNPKVEQEAAVLRKLHAADSAGRFAPFLPQVRASFVHGDDSSAQPRRVNVLRGHAEIQSPDSLYSLEEVERQYPGGLDGRDAAWIWRRILSVLGFTHQQGVIHRAVIPEHVLIDPRDHKVMLIDWCWAEEFGHPNARGRSGKAWHARVAGQHEVATAALDVALGARSIIELMGGDAEAAECPASVEPALARYFQRCAHSSAAMAPQAWTLLGEFDHLIETLWGERTFRVFSMPPRNGG
jgi:hypothetical protein